MKVLIKNTYSVVGKASNMGEIQMDMSYKASADVTLPLLRAKLAYITPERIRINFFVTFCVILMWENMVCRTGM